jgi:transposase
MQAVIYNHPGRKNGRRLVEQQLYRQRYLVEVFFHNLKKFRALATRYDKTARNYLARILLACAWLWLN